MQNTTKRITSAYVYAYVYANGWCCVWDSVGNAVIQGAWQEVKPWLQANYDGDVVFQDGTKTVVCKGEKARWLRR